MEEFKPNVTPREMFKKGVFGGTYFRDIHSRINKKEYKNAWEEFGEMFKGIDIKKYVSNSECDKNINKYKVKSGTSLIYWEDQGWINSQDPYGWVQWYCRYYNGRRSDDDERQIRRWQRIAGPNGRFRKWLINMNKDGKDSRKIRQLLLQWAVEIKN